MSELSAAQQKLESALLRLESAAKAGATGGGSGTQGGADAEALLAECESLRRLNKTLEDELARLREENQALGACNSAAAERVDEVLGRLKGVLAEQAA